MKHQVSHQVVADLLHELGYSLQANRKTKEGTKHPDRNAQFEHLNGKVKWSLARHQPVISVDTKKKELVGDFKNGGRELRPKGQPELVRVHDFVDQELGRATPYGIYDLGRNSGWVSVGMDHDTAEFAVETIRRWWRTMGQSSLSRGHPPADHRRRRWQQRFSLKALENRIAKTGRRNRAADRGLSLPARNQQVEQDRTSALLLHHPKLARKASPKLPDNRQSDRRDHYHNRTQGSCRAEYRNLSIRHQSFRSGTCPNEDPPRQISWRLELRNPAPQSIILTSLFLDRSLAFIPGARRPAFMIGTPGGGAPLSSEKT